MELPVNLLLVDDVGEDADMFAYALESLGRPVHLQHECSVESACDYLRGHDIDEIPDIIIVDSFLRGPSGDQFRYSGAQRQRSEHRGDLFVGFAFGDELEHLDLAGTEAIATLL